MGRERQCLPSASRGGSHATERQLGSACTVRVACLKALEEPSALVTLICRGPAGQGMGGEGVGGVGVGGWVAAGQQLQAVGHSVATAGRQAGREWHGC
jgi:hypothetical protein